MKIKSLEIPVIYDKYVKFIPFHQIETAEKLKKYDIVFNTYPTGSGKTRALLNSIKELTPKKVLIIAPINVLIDQYEEKVKQFVKSEKLEYEVVTFTSSRIKETKETFESNQQFVRKVLEKKSKTIIISNPDIVYLILLQFYGNNYNIKRTMVADLLSEIDFFAFDEFHYYDPIRSFLAITLLFTYHQIKSKNNETKKFLFLSATPSNTIIKVLKHLNLNWYEVKLDEGHNKSKEKSLSEINLDFSFGSLEDNIDKVINEINNYTSENGKIIIISNSLRRIWILKDKLNTLGVDAGIIIGPIKSKEERKRNLQKKVILATPTVDIGYDFEEVRLLIFEAFNPDEFLQRLGRAGRTLGKTLNFTPKVIAFLPKTVKYKFEQIFQDKNTITRKELESKIKEIFSSHNLDFEQLYRGPFVLQIAFFLYNFEKLFVKDDKFFEDYKKNFLNLYKIPVDYTVLKNKYLPYFIIYVYETLKQISEDKANKFIEFDFNKKILKNFIERKIAERLINTKKINYYFKGIKQFFDNYILNFRINDITNVKVVDKQKTFGIEKFDYSLIFILENANIERIDKNTIYINGISRKEKIHFEVPKIINKEFFVTYLTINEEFIGLEENNKFLKAVFLLNNKTEAIARSFGFYPSRIIMGSEKKKALFGEQALIAKTLFSTEKPWDFEILPIV
ncbi:hypothetical protein XJ44_01480 [Thermosipho affectus]|uniref:Helicase ATP-binding domain-containing protein n=1 Tax=Thermosipho affectus TaxID=660294 RepID=A0ABX3IJA3_9BACT|nr:type I-D CRISPR-associated helicase Cas3' [Thermosipho affectus]ONN27906.1 hypothetical protein XJ44_01480 [Thermosipho affectus]